MSIIASPTNQATNNDKPSDFRVRNLSDVGVLITIALFIAGLLGVWQQGNTRIDRLEMANQQRSTQEAADSARRDAIQQGTNDKIDRLIGLMAASNERTARMEARLDDLQRGNK